MTGRPQDEPEADASYRPSRNGAAFPGTRYAAPHVTHWLGATLVGRCLLFVAAIGTGSYAAFARSHTEPATLGDIALAFGLGALGGVVATYVIVMLVYVALITLVVVACVAVVVGIGFAGYSLYTTVLPSAQPAATASAVAGPAAQASAGPADAMCEASAPDVASPWREPISMQMNPLFESLTDEQLAEAADLVVIATVAEAASGRWNTPDGHRPSGTTADNLPHRVIIVTDRHVTVETSLKGSEPDDDLCIRTPGGTVGQDSILFSGNPPFVEGQRVVLFLTYNDWYAADDGLDRPTVVGGLQGMFAIVDDQAVRPDRALPLDELLAIIARHR